MENPIKNFLLFCSGANLEILGEPDCRTEHNKYVGIGGTILATAILAVISGSYALYTIFKIESIAILFGLLWGMIIFNLDRYIVSTIKKPQHAPQPDLQGRLRLFGDSIRMVAPRLLLAGLISFVITKPIELRLFEKEITDQLNKTARAEITVRQNLINAQFQEIDDLKLLNEQLKQEVEAKRKQRDDLRELAIKEGNGIGDARTTGKSGLGPAYRDRIKALEVAEVELNELNARNDARVAQNEQRIRDLEAQRNALIQESEGTIRNANSLLARLKAMSTLADDNPTVWLTSWFLVGLFLMLETAPIFAKLLSDRGPYDFLCETKEHQVYANEMKKMSELNDRINTDVALSTQLNAGRLRTLLNLNQRTNESLLSLASVEIKAAQMEIAKLVVQKWKNAELARLGIRRASQAPASGLQNNQPQPENGQGQTINPDPQVNPVSPGNANATRQHNAPAKPDVIPSEPEQAPEPIITQALNDSPFAHWT
jgi:hypothetical protein